MEERLTMTTRDLDRLKVIHQVLQHKLTWSQAGAQLARSVRQVGRLCARVRTEGHKGIIHRLRDRSSNHRLPAGRLAKALEFVRRHYPDFGPTFANEKLRSRHALLLSTSTLRRGMVAAGLWRPRPLRIQHRTWRPRRACVGELVQLDGSDHAWFEARAPRCVLLLYIDDATSRLLSGEFVTVEDTLTLLRTTQTYLQQVGRPVAFYVDKDSISQVNRQATIEEQLQDSAPLTQFTRAMQELGIEVIPAHSPQAKGRVERSFDTHQDRLVKELRLAKISTRPEANRFLQQVYLPAHNAAYAVEPANPTDAHRPLLPAHDLAAILSIQTTRTIAGDFTVRLQNRFFQLLPEQPVRLRPGETVLIEQRLDGTTHLRGKGRYVAFTPIAKPAPRPPHVARGPAAPGALDAAITRHGPIRGRTPRTTPCGAGHPCAPRPRTLHTTATAGGRRAMASPHRARMRCRRRSHDAEGETMVVCKLTSNHVRGFGDPHVSRFPPFPQTPIHNYDYDYP